MENEDKKYECEKNKLCSNDDIISKANLMTNEVLKQNNLKELKKYISEHEEFKDNSTEIKYVYDLDLQIYSTNNSNYTRKNPNELNLDLSRQDKNVISEFVFTEIFDNDEILKSKYEVLAGKLPSEYNEVVLIVGEDNIIPDSVLYALDIKDRQEAVKNLMEARKNNDVKVEHTVYSYDDILNHKYKLVLSANYYKEENGMFIDYSNDQDYMKKIIDKEIDLKVVGIICDKNMLSNAKIGYKSALTLYVINETSKNEIYKKKFKIRKKVF